MVKFRTIAQKIKERLEAEIPALSGLVVVYRRSDFDSRIEDLLARASGRSVSVRLISASNIKPSGKESYYVGKVMVTLFTVAPASPKDTDDSDEVMSAIEAALQGWWPTGVAGEKTMWIRCEGVQYPPDFKLLDGTTCDAAMLTLSAPGNVK